MAEDVNYVLSHDVSNVFMLPSSKKQSKPKKKEKSTDNNKKLILSKKKEKKLRKIVEKKQRKFTRSEVLEKLSQHQISQNELDMLASFKRIQQKVSKKMDHLNEQASGGLKTVAGSRRKRHCCEMDSKIADKSISGVYFETDSSSTEESESKTEDVEILTNSIKSQTADLETTSSQHNALEPGTEMQSYSKNEPNVTENKPEVKKGKPQSYRKTVFVPVSRTKNVQDNRLKLPILAMEQEIMETINDNPVTIICGATGSGKTTQVPQFLYEAGYCTNDRMIGITEPRRVAAMSTAARVATEMNSSSASLVAYQVRYEGNATHETRIKFVTDGVLLRELRQDFLLRRYSVIVVDEAHERGVYSDILIGLLSRVVRLRRKRSLDELKLVIMSATLRVDDFLAPQLFGADHPPPVLNVESRQFPVTVHFNRRTRDNFLQEAYKKCCQIHRRLPDGGILVFLPGQREVRSLVSRLKSTFSVKSRNDEAENHNEHCGALEGDKKNSDEDSACTKKKRKKRTQKQKSHHKISLNDYNIDLNDVDAMESGFLDDDITFESTNELDLETDEEEEIVLEENGEGVRDEMPMHVLPLYALLPASEQSRVFAAAPYNDDGCTRLCVVATNVAETSLTIPGVRYVVDCGRHKTRQYDPVTGASRFLVTWISKASAEQRAGRAGRTGPGHCYRLYSSAVFEGFDKFSAPEILARPADDLVLTMKNMKIARVINFPFPTAPPEDVLHAAEQRLMKLGALDDSGKITPLGKTMALFPVSPAYAKMLALGHQQGILPYVVCLVAALSVREPLVNLSNLQTSVEPDEQKELNKDRVAAVVRDHLKIRRQLAGKGENFLLGDLSVLLNCVLEGQRQNYSIEFCQTHGFRPKAASEIRKMRRQLTTLITTLFPAANLTLNYEDQLPPADQKQACALRQVVLSGLAWHVARRMEDLPLNEGQPAPPKHSYLCANGIADPVFIHPSSVLRRCTPEFVVFQELLQTTDKKLMINVTAVESVWLPDCARAYCSMGEPVADPQPWYDPVTDSIMCQRDCTFGAAGWTLGQTTLQHPLNVAYFKHIVVAFLRGQIFKELARYAKFLITKPETMLKTWAAKLQRERTEGLLTVFAQHQITGKRRLKEKFDEDKSFLLEEYCIWLPEARHKELQLIWPPDD